MFIDVDDIDYGADFVEKIEQTVGRCDAVVAVIGPNWLSAKDEHGGSRLEQPNDYVRLEIAMGLKRRIAVIPVLVDGAQMPRESELPDDLKALSRRNAIELRHSSFPADTEALIASLSAALPDTRQIPSHAENDAPSTTAGTKIVWIGLAGTLGAAAISGIIALYVHWTTVEPSAPNGPAAYELRIDRVELFPHSDSAVVQVLAIANGIEFRYPSIGGVEWLKVAPSMAGQTFRLPAAEQYDIRFEMLKREASTDDDAKLLSVETVSFAGGSTSGKYALHGFDPASGTRSGNIGAEVSYSIQAR